MQTEDRHKDEMSQLGKERLEAAKKDFDGLMKEVTPFIRKRKVKVYSTSGEWTTVSQAEREK
jgi:hypothetical protein